MIELPEALTIANQITAELQHKRIESGNRGNTFHKFAFYSREPEEYAAILPGKTVGMARGYGSVILVPVEPDYTLVFGVGGERILYHKDKSKLPKKFHLFLRFEDSSCLTVSVQGWGAALLLTQEQAQTHDLVSMGRVEPLTDAFSLEYFQGLFQEFEPESKTSIKYFIISQPGVWGVGNGYLQDILFKAKILPRRRVVTITPGEQEKLFFSIREVLQQSVDSGGRDTERNLYDQPGGYVKILDSRTVGNPCPDCGTTIEKESFLGGTVYFCPGCQV